jgi:hypothetical protein
MPAGASTRSAEAEEDGIGPGFESPQGARPVHVDAEAEIDAEVADHLGLRGKRLAELAVGSDRVTSETARLLARVVDRHPVSEQRELARAREPRRPGADDGDPKRSGTRSPAEAQPLAESPVGGVPLQAPDLDRAAALVQEDARPLAQDLDRADAGAGRAQEVLGEDRGGRLLRRAAGDGGDERRDVDARRARHRARRLGVRPPAVEAALRLDDGLLVRERRHELLERIAEPSRRRRRERGTGGESRHPVR